MRYLRFLLAPLGALLLLPAPASARPAPLDVRMMPIGIGVELEGQWSVGPIENDAGNLLGDWEGNTNLTESWRPAKRTPLRIHRPASARGERTYAIPVHYRRVRTSDGSQLMQLHSPSPAALTCGAAAGRREVTETATTTMRAIDQPAKNRVVFTGPNLEVAGPVCVGPGGEVRSLSAIPRDPSDHLLPNGAVRGWRTTISRPAVAEGGLLHFRGMLFASWTSLDEPNPSDVTGSFRVQGTVLIDVLISPAKRRD